MIDMNNLDTVAVKLAGVAGALVSMRFLQGSWPARLSMAASGALISYYAAPHLSTQLGIPEGLTGFLVGFFGMAVVSRAWEAVQAFPITAIWQAVIDRIRGKGHEHVRNHLYDRSGGDLCRLLADCGGRRGAGRFFVHGARHPMGARRTVCCVDHGCRHRLSNRRVGLGQ